MDENNETKREGKNITLTVHDGVIGGQCNFRIEQDFKKVMDDIVTHIFTEEKTNGSNGM